MKKLLNGVVLLMVVAGPVALADTIVFDLTKGNPALIDFTGPYAKAIVTLTSSTNATIQFQSLTNSGNIYLLGDGSSVGVNVNADSFNLSAISGSNSGTGFSPGSYSNGGSTNADGFGTFNQVIDSFDGFTNSSDTITFSITNTSGTWASAKDVLTPNGGGYWVEAHIFPTSYPADAANGVTVETGFAANDSGWRPPSGGELPDPIPEPHTLLLLGSGLLGAGFFVRRRE